MNMKRRSAILLVRIFFGCCFAVPVAAQEEGVFLNPVTGDYLVRFKSYGGVLAEGTFTPSTKIEPFVSSKLRQRDVDVVIYHYNVRNGKASKQDLITLVIAATSAVADSQNAPDGWDAKINQNFGGSGYLVGWSYLSGKAAGERKTTNGILPGANQEFEFRSADLPGVGVVRLRGAAPVTEFPDEGPDPASPVGKAYYGLRQKNFVPRLAAIPRIANPAPFNAATVLTGVKNHIDTDLVSMNLIAPMLVGQLDPWFASAIDAARRNNTEGLRHDIKELRRLLRQERPDMDKDDDGNPDDNDKGTEIKLRLDKLAARVLDFDLQYVYKQVQGDKD